MTHIEIFYDAERGDWLEALDRQVQDALDKLSYSPDVVLCSPAKTGGQLLLFKSKDSGHAERNNQ